MAEGDYVDFLENVYWVLKFCGKVPMVPILLHTKNQKSDAWISRYKRNEGDYIDFLENRVLSWPEIYWVFLSSHSALPVKKS
jgi:hypothetical protein